MLPWHTYIQADQIGPEIWIRKSIGDAPGPHWTGEGRQLPPKSRLMYNAA